MQGSRRDFLTTSLGAGLATVFPLYSMAVSYSGILDEYSDIIVQRTLDQSRTNKLHGENHPQCY